jgi:type VI secretion system protein VasD
MAFNWHHAAFATATLLLAGSCAAPPPPPPPAVLELKVMGGANENPDPAGHPLPMVLRIYDLASTAQFERADAFALIERGAAVLGPDSLGTEEIPIAPGETKTISHPLKPGVQAIGVVALFRDIDHAVWRAVQPAAPHGPTKLEAHTDGLKVTLAPSP